MATLDPRRSTTPRTRRRRHHARRRPRDRAAGPALDPRARGRPAGRRRGVVAPPRPWRSSAGPPADRAARPQAVDVLGHRGPRPLRRAHRRAPRARRAGADDVPRRAPRAAGDPGRRARLRRQGRRHLGADPGDPRREPRRERVRRPQRRGHGARAQRRPTPPSSTKPADRPASARCSALLARGLSNRDIGARLYISETTAKFHVGNILRKLGVSRRAEAVYEASKAGLI